MICACTVTSSAVVGSSAMSSAGRLAMPMAIIDALAHAAGILVRIVARARRRLRNADGAQHVDGALPDERRRDVPMRLDRLADLPADAHHRIERGGGILEDHADLVAANLPHLTLWQADQIAAGQHDAPAGNAARLAAQGA